VSPSCSAPATAGPFPSAARQESCRRPLANAARARLAATKSKKSKKKGGAKAKANGDAAAATNGHKAGDGADEPAGLQREEEEEPVQNGGEGKAESQEAGKTAELPLRSPTAAQSQAGAASTDPAPADSAAGPEATARLQALEKDHAALQEGTAQLRAELEEARAKHASELAETQAAKEKAEADYQTLLGRVNTIKSQLGDRLREDAVRCAGDFTPIRR
jgi:hypothetical protein